MKQLVALGLTIHEKVRQHLKAMVKCVERSEKEDNRLKLHSIIEKRSSTSKSSKAALTSENDSLKRQVSTSECQPQSDGQSNSEMRDMTLQLKTLRDETDEKENRLLDQIKEKDAKIVDLQKRVFESVQLREALEIKVDKIQQQLCRELEGSGAYTDGAATPFLLESTLKALQTSVSSFSRLFLEHCKIHNVDVNGTLEGQFPNTYLARVGHVAYMMKSWIHHTLLQNFENESFFAGGPTLFLDPNERRLRSFECFQQRKTFESSSVNDHCNESAFQPFWSHKLLDFQLVWPFLGDITSTHLSIVKLTDPPGSVWTPRLMESFKSVVKAAWTLHKLSLSFEPRAEIFRVRKGTSFDATYMDSVVCMQDDSNFVNAVGFMICPGFRLRRSVLRSQIYLEAATLLI